ncbi:uncharacterized protein LOC120343239 [Styela clava]|uniref:ankyrin repeat domain-containing protein 17-like n=1 Tax=Styela clava TaxID=7725 RepID=UPI00193A6B50|nr:ankyrin repeat domain-containing protein 17-like [Styela clava]
MLHDSSFTEMNDSNNNTKLFIEECKEPIDRQCDCVKVEVMSDEGEILSECGQELQEIGGLNNSGETENPVRSLIEAHIGQILGKFASNDQPSMTVACMSGCMPVVKYFAFNTQVDINKRDKDGNTALMLAAQGGHVNVIRFLLWNYENIAVDAENYLGVTALMKAALRGHSLCARILVLAGSDIEKRDRSRNFCAQEWALLCGFKQTAKVIKSVGTAGPLHISRKEVINDLKQSKFDAAKEMYSTVKRKISRTFCGNRRNWTDDVGSLFYLVDSTVHPNNVLWDITWDRPCILEDGDSSKERKNQNITNEHQQETCLQSFQQNQKKNSSRKYSAKEIPEITCTDTSPYTRRKVKYMQKQSKDKNVLQIPSRRRRNVIT